MFVAHYLALGLRVVLYDRFGAHKLSVLEFTRSGSFDYYPYTMMEKVTQLNIYIYMNIFITTSTLSLTH